MALDRQSIEKRDFPIGRRGYEPEAVDAHLASIAEQVDELRRGGGSAPGQPSGPASIAQAASEQVRLIVEAAETSAAEIERAAQDDAQRIRGEAEGDARRTRDEAVAESQEHVGRVRESTSLMLQRIEAMEGELSTLIDQLRTGANRVNADLTLIEQGLGDLQSAAGAPRTAGREPAPAAVPAAGPEEAEEPVADGAAPAAAEEPGAADEAPGGEGGRGGDVEGARLVALNMALNGSAREETARYLADNFDLQDRDALLDEVYATVEG